MYICLCNAITDRQIRACADEGACSLPDLEHRLGVGVNCGRCRTAAAELLNEKQPQSPPLSAAA